jgi:beta-lactamase class D
MQSTVMPLLGFLALVAASVLNAGVARADDILERPDLVSVFQEQGAVGTFALYAAAADRTTVVDRQRAEARFAPASTFKIANSLIALETGVVHDENEIIPYGGKPQPIKAWEKDMGLREAIKVSNVPVYQEIARRVGMARYEQWLAGLDYGNRQLGTVVDRFWLDGPLAISAVEQARFAARLGQGTLPASERAQAIVRDILQLETVDGAVLFGKTGWLTSHSPKIGWWVGWIERNGEVVAFALNIDMATVDDAPKRIAIGKALLVKLGVL